MTLPDPPLQEWSWEVFDGALRALADARAAHEDTRDAPLPERVRTRLVLDARRADMAFVRRSVCR